MKRLFYFITCMLLFTACKNIEPDVLGLTGEPATEVYISTRSSIPVKMTKSVESDLQEVYFFIRIDGNIPGEDEINLPANQYFPMTSAKKSMLCNLNMGTVQKNVEWKSCKKFSKYIYSTDGSSVQSIIVDEPTLEDLVMADMGPGDDFTGLLANKDSLHFLWYVCKKQDADKCWHVDGILTTKNRTDISETIYGDEIIEGYEKNGMVIDSGNVVRDGHVEVDIHYQEHKDWNEIKTSIHIRDTVDITVTIPLDSMYQCESDDMAIHTFNEELILIANGVETPYTVTVVVRHADSELVYTIDGITAEMLRTLRESYGDGLTVEIHSYVKNCTDEMIWDAISNSAIETDKYTKINAKASDFHGNFQKF